MVFSGLHCSSNCQVFHHSKAQLVLCVQVGKMGGLGNGMACLWRLFSKIVSASSPAGSGRSWFLKIDNSWVYRTKKVPFQHPDTSLQVLRIRIRMFLGLPDPDPLVRSWIRILLYHQAKIVRKTLILTILWLFFWLFIFEKWYKCIFKKY